MARAEREKLTLILTSHLNTIHETLQVLDHKPAAASLSKVNWEDVIKMGDQVSKQATIVGMLWTGNTPKASELEENMGAYFNVLQGFLLHFFGSTVGAGPTLSANLHQLVMRVVDSSFKLMKESIASYGSRKDEKLKVDVPVLVGQVWEACSALKKAPTTNITAIGRAMTQVAVSMKDVLREMKELKPAPTDLSNVTMTNGETSHEDCGEDDDDESDIGNDLSAEEMKVAEAATLVVSDTLVVVKELIRCITCLLKVEKSDSSVGFVDSLEKLLKLCQEIGTQIDELGACLYPPQEVPAMEEALEKILSFIHGMHSEVENITGDSDAFTEACSGLKSSMKQFETVLSCSEVADLETQLQGTNLSE